MGSSPNVNQYWDNFNHSELFRLFKTNEINLSGVKLKECYFDYAQDYIGAVKMISTLIKEIVFGIAYLILGLEQGSSYH